MSCYIASGYTYGKYLNQQNIELLTQSQSHEKITSVPPSSFPIWDVPGTQLKARAPTLILPTSAPAPLQSSWIFNRAQRASSLSPVTCPLSL